MSYAEKSNRTLDDRLYAEKSDSYAEKKQFHAEISKIARNSR
jgi:hypothetical protein